MPESTSDDPFRLVVESAPNGIIVADRSGRIVMVNQSAEKMFGYDRSEFLELSIEDLVPENIRGKHAGHRETFHKSPEPRQMGAGRDLRAKRKDGSEFPVEIGLTPLQSGNDTKILSSIVDITERKQNEEQLRQYAAELEAGNLELRRQSDLLRNVHDAVILVNGDGIVCEWNAGATRVFEMDTAEAIGKSLQEICPHPHQHPFFDRFVPALEKQASIEAVIACDLRSGTKLFLRTHVSKMDTSEGVGYVICASDITELKRLEHEILNVSENEQRRIGQDLHDDLCSQLSGIACITKMLEDSLKPDRKTEAELIARVTEMLADAVQKARQIAKGLVPAALETHGFSGALQELAAHFREVFGVNCVAEIKTENALDGIEQNAAVQLFRIAQEACTNSAKHSDADLIKISAGVEDGWVTLCVSDDGKGMPEDFSSTGMGLLTMRRRAEIIGAEFEIDAFPGEGATVRCRLFVPDS
ncbi:MAG: PAS domain S-box protein [Verrucomicrobiales bacterium]|nr:PAS domain S-box protein [Verrucomicrobiales bacterium]